MAATPCSNAPGINGFEPQRAERSELTAQSSGDGRRHARDATAIAQPGQEAARENPGRWRVTLNMPIFDARGARLGEEEKDVFRDTWQLDLAQRERSARGAARRFEPAPHGTATRVDVPEHEHRQECRGSSVSDEHRVLHVAVLSAAMREQGFGAGSISHVRQRAQAMREAFETDGVQVRPPRVFDPGAPSEPDRRTRSAPRCMRTREIERTRAEPSLPTR
jgi:hypothetical protein